MHLMEVTSPMVVQVEAAFMARAPVQAEAVFTVRAIRVTRVAIISNPTKVISNNNNNSPSIKVTQNS